MRFKMPKNNDIRVVKRFAIFPIRIGYEIRWLEVVKIQQIFYSNYYDSWRNTSFIDMDKEV